MVLPAPRTLSTADENIIMEAKLKLKIPYDLDNFQVQAVLGLLNNENVIVVSPCGS